MAEFAWFNLGGVWFKIHGDPGSDEAKVLMKKAVGDLAISKAQNVNNLDIIDVNRHPYYNIKSHYGNDVIEIWAGREELKRRKPLEIILEKEDEPFSPNCIAFEAYDFEGNRIGYVLCADGALGGYQLILSNNVVNPHPTYPFSMLHADHQSYAPNGYTEWGEEYLAERDLESVEGIDLVYPYHFPDWKLCTGWADVGTFYRGYEDPDQYVDNANPYPLQTVSGEDEVLYPHTIQPPDKFLFTAPSLEGDGERMYHDVSQHTKFEEKLMDWIPEYYPMQAGMAGASQAYSAYEHADPPYSPGAASQIHCEFYDPRFGTGQIRGVRRGNTKTYALRVGTETGVSVTEQGEAIKLALEWGESAGWWTYADQWSFPWVDRERFAGEGTVSNIWSGWEYKTVVDARYWYNYDTTLPWDDFSSSLGYDPPNTIWATLDYGNGDYTWNSDSDKDVHTVIASVAENEFKYAAIIEKGQLVSADDTTGILSTACGKLYSPQYYAGQSWVNTSNCSLSTSNTAFDNETYESYLEVNGQKLHTFVTGETENYIHDSVGFGFVRWWEDIGWIGLNVSLASRGAWWPGMNPHTNTSVIYQLWDDTQLTKLAEVTFDVFDPSDEFLDNADAPYGTRNNWHTIEGVEYDEAPVVCSGHFRCLRVLDQSDPIKTTEKVYIGETDDTVIP